MKNTVTLLHTILFFFILSVSKSQQTSNKVAPGLYLGLNSGGAWQTSDVDRRLGFGLGGNIEAYLTRSSTNILGFSARAAYLYTNHTGQDKVFTQNFQENPLVNGDFGSNYIPQNLALYNYKTQTQDLSLQFLIHANQLRQKGIILYGMGGLGATGYTASSDLKNSLGDTYDYTTVISSNEAKNIQDGVYETEIDNQWVFTPTLGLGLGYQFTDNFTAGIEYRTLFTATDLLDATRFKGNVQTSSLDKYHYLSFQLGLKIGNFNATTPRSTKGSNASGRIPIIEGRGIGTATSYLYTCEAKLPLRIFYIDTESDIQVFVNGKRIEDVYYSFRKNKFDLRYSLNTDTVTIKVVATNGVGSDSFQKRFICDYTKQQIIKNSPTIRLTTPGSNSITTFDCNQDIRFYTTNINSLNQIVLIENGDTLTQTDYSFSSNQIKLNRNISGTSRINAIVTNETGTASAYAEITCNSAPPVVRLISPISHNVNDFNVNAKFSIDNISTSDVITVFENNIPLSTSMYTVNFNREQVRINKTIDIDGVYTYVVKVTSTRGNSSDFVTYNAVTPKEPKVWFSNNITSYQRCFQSFILFTKNIDNRSQISITVNSFKFNRYTFDPQTGRISFNHLIPANSIIIVEVINDYGTQTVTRTVACGAYNTGGTTTTTGGSNNPNGNTTRTAVPEISLESSPNVNVSCGNSTTVLATIRYINSKNDIKVYENGKQVFSSKYSYNTSTQKFSMPFRVNVPTNLVIKASTSNGTDSESISLNCSSTPTLNIPTIEVVSTDVNPTSCEATIKAQVQNVTYKSGINVSLNGQKLASAFYTYTNGTLTIRKNIPNSSKVLITATNTSGTATAEKELQCRKPPKVGPSIFEVSKSTRNCLIEAEYKVQNIKPSEISVTNNGVDYPYTLLNSTLTLKTGKINEPARIVVTATTATATIQKVATFNCVITAPIVAPTISIDPSTLIVNQTNCTATIKASTTGITQSSEVQVTLDGQQIPFNYLNNEVTINASNINLNSSLEIMVTNTTGSQTDKASLSCAPLPTVKHLSSFVNNCLLNATFRTSGATKDNISVIQNGKTIPFEFKNDRVKINSHPISGSVNIEVVVTNGAGTAKTSKSFSCVSQVDFNIKNGTVIPDKNYKVEVTVIGCALKVGGNGADYPVQVQVYLNGVAQNPFGTYAGRSGSSDVNTGTQHKWLSGNVPANAPISIKAKSFNPSNNSATPAYEQSSESNSRMVKVLKNGDSVPNINGFQGQDAAEDYLKPYIENGKIKLNANQAIYLFELGTDRTDVQWYDLQDCVVLVSLAQAG